MTEEIPLSLIEAPNYCKTMTRDDMLKADILRVHCMWKGQEYGLEYALADTERQYAFDPEGLEVVKWALLVDAFSDATVKVGLPRLTRCVRVRDLRVSGSDDESSEVYPEGS